MQMIGVLMDVVPGAWDLRKSEKTPEFMKTWDVEKLRQVAIEIFDIEAKLFGQGIRSEDLTFFFDESGKPWVGDLDLFRQTGSDPKVRELNRHFLLQRLVNAYFRATGVEVNPFSLLQ